jgi:glycosyltransferase involved in cell wall biosynthesis
MRRQLETTIRRHGLSDHVELVGAQTHAQVLERYRAADLFALACMTDYLGWQEVVSDPVLLLEVGLAIPFRPLTDGIPNVIAEAMAMELPIVSTTVAGVPELVEDGRSGVLVPEQDPVAFAAAIERVLDDPEQRRAMGRRGRARVLEVFDRAQNIRDLIDLFDRFGGTPQPRPATTGRARVIPLRRGASRPAPTAPRP